MTALNPDPVEGPNGESSTSLPDPDSNELKDLLKGAEAREAYRWLWQNRTDPQPMAKWVERSREVFGKTNSNTGRRLRGVYAVFDVRVYPRADTGEWVYELVGRLARPLDAAPISKALEAQVYVVKGRYCAMCGLGPIDGVKLQIDHIMPREWGGLTALENLEPLCAPHNHGKKAFFASFDEVGPLLRRATAEADPWSRIGELLKGFYELGRACPVELIFMAAKDTHRGDPLKRLRELGFVLGWQIKWSRQKDASGVTHVTYSLTEEAPAWPPEGPASAVTRYERERRARKRRASEGDVAR